jgi:hypothetical protein
MDDAFLIALAVTVVVETAVLVAAVRLLVREGGPSTARLLVAGFLASSWSLPYFWFLLPRFVSGAAYVPVGECLVTLGEAVVLRFVLNVRYRTGLCLSVLCNAASWLSGLVLIRAFG